MLATFISLVIPLTTCVRGAGAVGILEPPWTGGAGAVYILGPWWTGAHGPMTDYLANFTLNCTGTRVKSLTWV